ncbi:methionine gamma-lyase [Alteribacillus sp. HJP-4]|uniref:methionine gamma-lyase n=1 Tax=Alteribacillus sp. HJP-4 TaxID=2775394 RepID=UPI0035CCF44F
MTQMNKKQLETRAIHGKGKGNEHGSLVPPIYQTSTFSFASAEQGEQRFAGNEKGYIYSRLANPTVRELEEKIADLEGAEDGIAFSSGMAAISSVLASLVKSGDHLLISEGVYGCTFGLLTMLKDRFQVEFDLIEMDDEAHIRSFIKPNTKAVYVETPINPTMRVIDMAMLSSVTKDKGLTLIVDNTFASPILQRPLEFGADVVIHSATKYIGGHGDLIAGLACGSNDFITGVRSSAQKDMGGILGPFDAWLLLRGLKTLSLRMHRHCSTAKIISEKLRTHKAVEKIYYPGDPDFSYHALAQKQMDDSGGLLSFELKGNKQTAQAFMNQLSMIKIAVSLGDAETLIQHPATMTHAVVPEQERQKMKISDRLLRLSFGLESPDDIWEDLEQALNKTTEKVSKRIK